MRGMWRDVVYGRRFGYVICVVFDLKPKIDYMILCVEEEKLTSAMLILFFKIILVLRTLIVNTLIVRILHFELHGRTQVD